MQTILGRAALALVGCVAVMILDGCRTTTTTVTTTTSPVGATTPSGSTPTGSMPNGSTPSGSTSGGSTSYTVGGTVSGLGANQSLTLLDNGGDAVVVNGNGAFTFPTQLAGGSAYAVTMKSHTPGIACSVSDGSGAVASADVTSIAVSCAAGTEAVLFSFSGGPTGAFPQAGVIVDGSGNLYGTTQQGGKHGHGTVFKLSASGKETVLHSFGDSDHDGQDPQGTLVMDTAGNLYGVTPAGGENGNGTLFKVAPDGTETILYSFGGTDADGRNPVAGLVTDSAGNLYGTTPQGGAYGVGTVFKVSPAGVETILHSFYALGIASDGQHPQGSLVMDSAGNLYGTTPNGGDGMAGTVFKVSANGTETVLYSFGTATATDGSVPYAGVIVDSAGNLHGTTTYGGANGSDRGDGTVFTLSAAGKETALYSFGGTETDGLNPYASLVIDSSGNLFGTTSGGGADASDDSHRGGTVFELSAAGKETVLYSFGANGASDGSNPHEGLLMDSAGNLYGTTVTGGANGDGAVFKID